LTEFVHKSEGNIFALMFRLRGSVASMQTKVEGISRTKRVSGRESIRYDQQGKNVIY